MNRRAAAAWMAWPPSTAPGNATNPTRSSPTRPSHLPLQLLTEEIGLFDHPCDHARARSDALVERYAAPFVVRLGCGGETRVDLVVGGEKTSDENRSVDRTDRLLLGRHRQHAT